MSREPNLVARCDKCSANVHGKAWGNAEFGSDEFGDTFTRYTLVTCPWCASPLLLEHEGDRYTGVADWAEPRRLYPPPYAVLDSSVPPPVAHSYEEAAKAFHSGLYMSTAVMCRRTLEGVCSRLGAKGRTLAAKLKDLHDQKKLDQRIYDWSVEILKNLGNDAAHNVEETIAPQDAKDAIEFTRAIVEHLFVFEAAFQRFKARRAKQEARAAEEPEES